MRFALAFAALLLLACPVAARADASDIGPSVDRNEARWAEWDAQARMTDGDYEGAVQAEQQAEVERQKADQQKTDQQAAKSSAGR